MIQHSALKFSKKWKQFLLNIRSQTKTSLSDSCLLPKEKPKDKHAARQEYSVIRAMVAELKVCSTQRDLSRGKQIHSKLVATGRDSNVFVASSLINMYAKCGSLSELWRVFNCVAKRDVILWNCVILGYAECGEAELALQLFVRMQEEGFIPDDGTFVATLKACAILAETEEGTPVDGKFIKVVSLGRGRAVHCFVATSGYERKTYVSNTMVDMYAKCDSLVEARRAFEIIPCRDVASWNCITLGYAHSGQGKPALELLSRMRDEGFKPTIVTFLAALKAYAAIGDEGSLDEKKACLEKVLEVHRDAAEGGHEHVTQLGNTLVDTYAKCGSMSRAVEVFNKMQQPDVVSWSSIIMGYAQSGEAELALQLYARMHQEGCTPNGFTFAAVLRACGVLADLKSGKRVQEQMRNAGVEFEIRVANALVDFYGKCGSMEDAEQVFSAAPRRNLVTWSSLIAGYSRQGNSERVFTLLEAMKKEKLPPDAVTLLSVLTVCCHAGLVEEGRKCLDFMHSEHGIVPRMEHYSCMVELLGRVNRLEDAVELAESMPHDPDEVVWTSILNYCWQWKNVTIGRVAFDHLIKLGNIKNPSGIYVLMSNIYKAAGMWNEDAKLKESIGSRFTCRR